MTEAIFDDAVRDALAKLGGKGSATAVANQMGWPKSGKRWDSLKQALERLHSTGQLAFQGRNYLLVEAKPPPPPVEARPPDHADQRIIEAFGLLKRSRTYPAVASEILGKITAPKPSVRQFGPVLAEMAKQGILMVCKRGRSIAYILAGDDPRYSATPDEDLKFQLLAEIEELRAQIVELRAQTAAGQPAETPAAHGLDESVCAAIQRLAKKARRRTVQLWQLREALAQIPMAELDQALLRLGFSWKVELQPVQDSTKLSEQQKDALLSLPDGTKVVAVAIGPE
jgi:hypothetical protein